MNDKANILLIITDHHAFYRHNRPGEYKYVWPCFEEFASQGVSFSRAYSVHPLCSPARASMMTGMYPSKHGLVWNTERQWPDNLTDLRQGQLLYSHYLSRVGYRNAYVGKWHCGHERLPVDYGIEGWSLPDYGKVYMSKAYRTYAENRGFGDACAYIEHNLNRPDWEGQKIVLHDPSPWRFMNGSGILEGPPEAHEEQFVAHLAVKKLRELAKTNQPWSLVASFWGPHQPYFPSEQFASMVDPETIPEYPTFRDDLAGRPIRHLMHRDFHHVGAKKWKDWSVWQEILARCYAQGLQLDAAVNGILCELGNLGFTDNTLVIWCADHGDAVASHGGLWDKASTFTEEVSRIPLAIRWPARFAGGGSVSRLVSNMDATATILEAAGIPVPEAMDSRSLLPLCKSNVDADWPDELICEHNGHGGEVILQRIVIHDRFKYVAALYDGDELYDLAEDPYELHNLVDRPEYREVKVDLRQRIVAHIGRTRDTRASRLAYSLKQGF